MEGSSDVPQLAAEELIAHASTSLQNEVAFLTRDQSIQFARYFHDEDAIRYNQRLDERRTKLRAAVAALALEATDAGLILADYPRRCRITVFAYWCIQRKRLQEEERVIANRWRKIFGEKIQKTKEACVQAHRELGGPAAPSAP